MSGEDQQAKLERLRTVRLAHREVFTKLTRESEEIMSHSELNNEGISHLKTIREQLVGKMEVFLNVDSEIVALCVINKIERGIEESEATTAKLVESKQKIDAAISTTSREGPSPTLTVPTPSLGEVYAKPRMPQVKSPKVSR